MLGSEGGGQMVRLLRRGPGPGVPFIPGTVVLCITVLDCKRSPHITCKDRGPLTVKGTEERNGRVSFKACKSSWRMEPISNESLQCRAVKNVQPWPVWLSRWERRPVHRMVRGLIPSQGSYPGYGFNPWSGCVMGRATD